MIAGEAATVGEGAEESGGKKKWREKLCTEDTRYLRVVENEDEKR